MKKEEYPQMPEKLSNEIESIVLTQGKPYRLIISGNKLFFTIYTIRIKGVKWFALVACEDVFKLLGEDKKDNSLLLMAQNKDIILRELDGILGSFKDMNFLVA